MTRIASHRGGTLEFGDSTRAGFEATAGMPVEEVEFDLHPTSDGHIIVHHDPTLDRTTDLSGAIAEMTAGQVRGAIINYGQNSGPLLLEELCEIFSPSSVELRCEFKPDAHGRRYENFVPLAISRLEQQGALAKTNFSSFLIDYLDEIAQHCTRPRLWLVNPIVLLQIGGQGVIEIAKSHEIPEIGVQIDTATPQLMKVITDAGLQFGCYAAHTSEQISKALEMGVKIFTTDRPSLALRIRAQFEEGTNR
ncbi:glycerophosphodiester phosphodiesterase family protein [uncultured Cohaesibacter sp.]|uniref:glycerophosphodiester phosphodiesterase family protein n=1 Tax=uncultured Cohaesibacter sp. TaxID=1002546 RepID=UPI00292FB90A|nr:glycerophosphodiester phosphodiesterase family protein [uncultured Cohaesibacter sp.]